MTRTESTMMNLGTPAPGFALPDTDGRTVRLADFAGKPLLVMFICNHCPFVKHVAPQLAQIGHEYQPRGMGMVAVNANDAEQYPDDAPDKMRAERIERSYTFPYLVDADQSVARAYGAVCTPDFFLFDANHELVYRGQLDDTRPHRIRSGVYDSQQHPPTGADLRAAMEAVLNGRAPDPEQKPSMGCNIKWKPGNAPS